MSLLIKALQKAEQSKSVDDKPSSSGLDLSLEPLALDGSAGPTANTHADAQSLSDSVQGQKYTSQQASSMLAAKHEPIKNSSSKKIWLVVSVTLLVLLAGMELYGYLDSLKQPDIVAVRPAGFMPAVPETATVAPNNAVSPPAVEPAVVAPAAAAVNKDESTDAEAMAKEKVAVAQEERPRPQRKAQMVKSQQLEFGAPAPTNEEAGVKITRNNLAAGVNPNLLAAYQAFNAGDDTTAQRYYRQVLQGDVRNVDALLGMAAIALRQERKADAAGWYGKVLEIEPRNSIAQAAMISILGQADPVASESRIKNLLAQQPDAAHLHEALGNLYAEQNQWPAAQQAYFQAYHFDSHNAQYAFNLAVSLDQLGKSVPALEYYKRALELSTKSGAQSIDRAQLESRISQLQ
ncbi:MAG TPA: tetratricopeptide repeat protein [Methylophilaceae bacterium]|nr:tetratricopeptide repeat protein [Methylophilaceae bacterium]